MPCSQAVIGNQAQEISSGGPGTMRPVLRFLNQLRFAEDGKHGFGKLPNTCRPHGADVENTFSGSRVTGTQNSFRHIFDIAVIAHGPKIVDQNRPIVSGGVDSSGEHGSP